jgi:hypothetical protein
MGDHDFIIDIIKGIQPQEPRWLPSIKKKQQIASIVIISNTSQQRPIQMVKKSKDKDD